MGIFLVLSGQPGYPNWGVQIKVSLSHKARRMVCWSVSVNLLQTRVTWEERASRNYSHQIGLWTRLCSILLINDGYEKAQPTMGRKFSTIWESKRVDNFPLQFWTSLKDGLGWCVSQINSFLHTLLLAIVFITAAERQTRRGTWILNSSMQSAFRLPSLSGSSIHVGIQLTSLLFKNTHPIFLPFSLLFLSLFYVETKSNFVARAG